MYGPDGETAEIFLAEDNPSLPEYRIKNGRGAQLKVSARRKRLQDALNDALLPLDNLKNVLEYRGQDEGEPSPIYYIMEKMLNDAEDRIAAICRVVEKRMGRIELDVSEYPFFGVLKRGQIIDVHVEGTGKEA